MSRYLRISSRPGGPNPHSGGQIARHAPMAPVTAHISGPLAARQICTEPAVCQDFANALARVLQPVPATVPALQNTCFFAYPDSAVKTN